MIDLYLVRHGESEANVDGTFPHDTVSLTEKGLAQAELLGGLLTNRASGSVRVLSSPLLRAVGTAKPAVEKLGVPLELEPLLRERDYGPMAGSEVGTWKSGDAYIRQPGGELVLTSALGVESIASMAERARLFLEKLASNHVSGTVIAVSHGSFIRTLLACIDGVDPLEAASLVPQIANATFARRLLK